MKDYQMVLMYLSRAEDSLQAAMDELDEFGDKGLDKASSALIKEQGEKVRQLTYRVRNHENVLRFAAQGKAM